MIAGKFLLFTALSFFTFQPQVSASDDVNDPLTGFTVSKDDIVKGLDHLKSEGKISQADYDKAKSELSGMSDSSVDELKDKAVGIVRNNPDKALELVKAPKVNPEEVQKQLKEAGLD